MALLLLALTVFSMWILPGIPQVQHWDQLAVDFFARHRTSIGITIFRALSAIGGTWAFLIALFFPAILYFRRRRWALGIYYLAGMGLLKLSVSLWKHLISRPRPEGGLEITTSFSMPSGHAANAVLIFGMLGIVCLKASNPFGRWLGFTVCLALVFLIGFSRVYLGVHYPSDVLLGSLYAASGLWLLQFFRKDMFNL